MGGAARCTYLWVGQHQLWLPQNAAGKQGHSFGGGLWAGGACGGAWLRTLLARRKVGRSCSTCAWALRDKKLVSWRRRARRGWPHPGASRMLTKWAQPTRLGTRTKESNVCASVMVANHGAQ